MLEHYTDRDLDTEIASLDARLTALRQEKTRRGGALSPADLASTKLPAPVRTLLTRYPGKCAAAFALFVIYLGSLITQAFQ
jgi:hypothetical protein